MGEFLYKKINDDEERILLGYRSKNGDSQEAYISLRYGANLCRYSCCGLNIIDYDPALLHIGDFTGTPVLYPTPNRVENGRFTFDGEIYEQVKRGRRVLEHGLVFNEPWELVRVGADEQSAFLSARIKWTKDSSLYPAFPFLHSLTLNFRLGKNVLCIAYDIHNTSSECIPYGFGLHPYFQKCSGEENTLIELPVDYVMEATEALLPTGKVIPVSETNFDLNNPVPIGKLDLDHVFLRTSGDAPAVIHYKDRDLMVKINATEEFSHYVVYSPSGMSYFCVESQTCSTNAHNLYARGLKDISGLAFVAPGAHKTGQVVYRLVSAVDSND